MESSKSVQQNLSQNDQGHNMKEGNEFEDDFDYGFGQYEDGDIDDDKFCSSVLRPQSKEIIGGINLKDLCEGKEVMFQMNDKFLKDDKEEFSEQEDDDDRFYDDEEAVYKSYMDNVGDYKKKQPVLYLDEPFESLVTTMTNITDDGCIKKEEIIGGVGKVIPENSYVVVHYNLFKETSEEPFDSTYLRKRPERINLGQNDLLPGLEIAIKTMRKRESSRFFIKWNYAFGALGCPDRIEPKCDIIADITLLSFKEIDALEVADNCSSLFERDVLQIRLEQRKGSNSFREGKIKQAIRMYKNSVRMINSLSLSNDQEERVYQEIKVKSLVNLAICYNKLGQHELACVMCQEALSITPRNKKALFHYGRASIALSNYSKARTCLMKLNRMCPHNQEVVEELRKLDLKKQVYNMATREFWMKAFKNVPEEKEDEAKSKESNSPRENSRDDTNNDYKEEFKGRRPDSRSTEEDEISRKFKQTMNLEYEEERENFLELD